MGTPWDHHEIKKIFVTYKGFGKYPLIKRVKGRDDIVPPKNFILTPEQQVFMRIQTRAECYIITRDVPITKKLAGPNPASICCWIIRRFFFVIEDGCICLMILTHVKSKIDDLICASNLFRSTAVANLKLSLK